ncbi:acyltransferase [uncultured Polaribacter sp.]|uniref:acyltransferase family protein n=1 Tax=uncultured Polaribacter sp. TaxID=174711 RepID=UPI0026257ED1|nr:acyltransferase [uncultured Polaribacter sp.]
MKRLYNLDYLRGVAAFGIMIYHYLSWILGRFTADTFFGRFGIYGVSIFYILSGLTLFYVYYDKMTPLKNDLTTFFKKRVFRIFPLLWLTTITAIILNKKIPNLSNLFLNLSGLFGFIKWETYFSAGVWSIGNELVFYVFLPIFILLHKAHKPIFVILNIILFSFYLYFAFIKLNPELTLTEQWTDYVNPLNQVFLFLSGFLIGLLFRNSKVNNLIAFFLLFIGLNLLFFLPAKKNVINLVTGINRLFFTFSCLLICFGFYKLTFKLPNFIHKPLALLGKASYSIYLLHPIVYIIIIRVRNHTFDFPILILLILSISLTLIVSYFTYEYFEKYFIKLGKK